METSSRCLEDVFRLRLQKTSSRRFRDVLIKTNILALLIHLQKTSSRRLIKINIFVLVICLQEVFKTSSRRLRDVLKTSLKRLQDVLQRCLQDAFKTYHVVILFLLTCFQYVFKTYSYCF